MDKRFSKGFILKLLSFQTGCFILATILCLSTFYTLEYFKYRHRIYKNIQVCHIDLSTKTLEEATSIIENQVIDPLLSQSVSLTMDGFSIQIPLQNYYISSNLEEVLKEVVSYTTSLTLMERLALLRSTEPKNFTIQMEFDEAALLASANDFITSFNQSPSNANISINTSGQITTVSHVNGQSVDQTSLLAHLTALLENYSHQNYSTDLMASNSSSTVKSRIVTEPSSLQIDLAEHLKMTNATITLDQLQSINTLVSSCTTSFSASAANATNIILAAEAINDTVLMPGEVFSFNELVGNTTLDKGYVYAPVIVNSQLAQGVGGGVCQVSSTLYNAILSAGLLPTERQPHSRPSSYLPLGLDSTIDWGNIDLQFENTLDFPLYISAFTESGKLHINLYSNDSLLDTRYELSSEIIKVLPSAIKTIKDSSLPKGTRVLKTSGQNGYYVKVLRHTYRDDELLSSEVISWDTYNPVHTVYRVG